jgi:hypothetical protein
MSTITSRGLPRCGAVLLLLWIFTLSPLMARESSADGHEVLSPAASEPENLGRDGASGEKTGEAEDDQSRNTGSRLQVEDETAPPEERSGNDVAGQPVEEQPEGTEKAEGEIEELAAEEDEVDTPDVETDTTVDGVEDRRGWSSQGALRPIVDYFDRENRDGTLFNQERLGARLRLEIIAQPHRLFRFGTRLAGVCFTGECDVDFVMESATPSNSGLEGGQFTFDELFVQWSRRNRFDIAVGRLQTRFVLRGGVYAKSLDRNDSNNVNVTWTDGLQATYRAQNGWRSNLVLQRNDADGTGSIRRGPLDFDDSAARNTYFIALENRRKWGPFAQRNFDVSYLPRSLLKDGDKEGRRVDYWGLVGRLAARYPDRREGLRLRAGLEVGYAPETATAEASRLGGSGDVDGLAWNVVASAMDFAPGHSIGLNYGRTGAGWYLSPQFRPNEELFEIRHQWRPSHFPLLEARVRWREELDQLVGTEQRRKVFDFYLRLTWEFNVKEY